MKAIGFCLAAAGIDNCKVDFVAYSFDPWRRRLRAWSEDFPLSLVEGDYGTVTGETEFFNATLAKESALRALFPNAKFSYFEHHECHAASAFFSSPFDDAAVLVVDGIGESATTWMGFGSGSTIEPIAEISYPDSLGFLWEKISEFVGFDPYDGPGKLMALARTCENNDCIARFSDAFDSFVTIRSGNFSLDPIVCRFRERGCAGLEQAFRLKRESLDLGAIAALATVLQDTTEKILRCLADSLWKTLNGSALITSRLCLAGGVALNCVANQALASSSSWEDMWVQPAANDAGTAIGAAQLAWYRCLAKTSRVEMLSPYLGPSYTSNECEDALLRAGLAARKPACPSRYVAEQLAAGATVAWFQGRMEWGPRALGNRSILASPSDRRFREVLNSQTKGREAFRPFAPAIPCDRLHEYFNGNTSDMRLRRFMLTTLNASALAREVAPAALHNQGGGLPDTARVQSVDRAISPLFAELLTEFGSLTGVPILLNTSFNIGEPIVASPGDACRTFIASSLDCMVLGPYVVERRR